MSVGPPLVVVQVVNVSKISKVARIPLGSCTRRDGTCFTLYCPFQKMIQGCCQIASLQFWIDKLPYSTNVITMKSILVLAQEKVKLFSSVAQGISGEEMGGYRMCE